MPARVHTILVTRSGATSHERLLRSIAAIKSQSHPVDALTLVVCGSPEAVRASEAVTSAVEAVIVTRATTTAAAAVALALPRIGDDACVWVLTDEALPDTDALERLVGAMERSPSAAIAAPKLLNAERPSEIVSFGQSMTRFGRSVELAAGEYDQGQHDGEDDALGADLRGLLLRPGIASGLFPDPGLGDADEGLDMGVRARLAGGRLVLVAAARVRVTGESSRRQRATARESFSTRRAQLHRRLVYAAAPLVPLHWLSLFPLALWRTIVHLVAKRPVATLPEWGAAAVTAVSPGAVVRARRGIRAHRQSSWASIAPLRVSRADLRQRLEDEHGSERGAVNELRFFSGGGAWAVLAGAAVGVAVFFSLLAWPALGGGALLPLRETVAALWRDAGYGLRGTGLAITGPADPFSGVLAVMGTLWPAAPSFSLVLLWLLALPLAVLGGWFAATRVSERPGLRILGGAAWMLTPSFLAALMEGRPAAVLAHLLLPWLFYAGAVAHRSWGAAGAASLLAAATAACAPSLIPAIALLWAVALLVALVSGAWHGAVRVLWVFIPTVVMFAPLALWHLSRGSLWSLLTDPGALYSGDVVASDAAGRAQLLAGYPTADPGGWGSFLGADAPGWVFFLAAPLAVLALLAPMQRRWAPALASMLVLVAGLGTAMGVVGIAVAYDHSVVVPVWPGAGLSLAWLGAISAAILTLDALPVAQAVRAAAGLVVGGALAVSAVPALTAPARDDTVLTNGPISTLPAYVSAQNRGDQAGGTLILTPQEDGGLATTVVWGPSATLGAQSSIVHTAQEPLGTSVSTLAVDLLSERVFDAPSELGALGIRYVLLDQQDGRESDAARELRLDAIAALDQRAGFVRAGETEKGALWRLDSSAPWTPPAEAEASVQRTAGLAAAAQLIVLLGALLLALPTRASTRAAKRRPRLVGLAREPRSRPMAKASREGASKRQEPSASQDVATSQETATSQDVATSGEGSTSQDGPVSQEVSKSEGGSTSEDGPVSQDTATAQPDEGREEEGRP